MKSALLITWRWWVGLLSAGFKCEWFWKPGFGFCPWSEIWGSGFDWNRNLRVPFLSNLGIEHQKAVVISDMYQKGVANYRHFSVSHGLSFVVQIETNCFRTWKSIGDYSYSDLCKLANTRYCSPLTVNFGNCGTDSDCIFILLIQLNIRICTLNNESFFLRLLCKSLHYWWKQ